MNHENTKSKNHEMFRVNFRGFVMKKTSNIQPAKADRILNFLLAARSRQCSGFRRTGSGFRPLSSDLWIDRVLSEAGGEKLLENGATENR